MTELKSNSVAAVLRRAQDLFGWDGFVYSFTVGIDWTAPDAVYVRSNSASMFHFLRDYRAQGFQTNHHRLSLVRNDLPQTFLVSDIPTSPLDEKLALLLTGQGWHSGMAFPQYGYGGALGLTIFVGRETQIDPRRTEQCTAYMAGWQMQLNAWARELIEQNSLARKLSPREVECLTLVAEGKTSRRIADIIGISTRTVEFHIQNAIHKLGGSSRSQAASMLVQLSLPQLGPSVMPAVVKH